MRRRFRLVPLLLLVAAVAAHGAACRSKNAPPAAGRKVTIAAKHWVTPLMTPPPPRPTVTMWPAVTRVPPLPE